MAAALHGRRVEGREPLLNEISNFFVDEDETQHLAKILLENIPPYGEVFIRGERADRPLSKWSMVTLKVLHKWCQSSEDPRGGTLYDALIAIGKRDVAKKFRNRLGVEYEAEPETGTTQPVPSEEQQGTADVENQAAPGTGTTQRGPPVQQQGTATGSKPDGHIARRPEGILFKTGDDITRDEEKRNARIFLKISKKYNKHWGSIVELLHSNKEKRRLQEMPSGALRPLSPTELLVDSLHDWVKISERPTGKELYQVMALVVQDTPDEKTVKHFINLLELPPTIADEPVEWLQL